MKDGGIEELHKYRIIEACRCDFMKGKLGFLQHGNSSAMPRGGTGAGAIGGSGLFGNQAGHSFGIPKCMVAVLVANLVPNMGRFLPPSVNDAFLGTKMVPSMRHCRFGGFLVSKTGTKNAATLTLPAFA